MHHPPRQPGKQGVFDAITESIAVKCYRRKRLPHFSNQSTNWENTGSSSGKNAPPQHSDIFTQCFPPADLSHSSRAASHAIGYIGAPVCGWSPFRLIEQTYQEHHVLHRQRIIQKVMTRRGTPLAVSQNILNLVVEHGIHHFGMQKLWQKPFVV